MNRRHLPRELKAVFCQQVLKGKWTVEQAADISTYSVQSVKRWLQSPIPAGEEPVKESEKRSAPRSMAPELRQILDEAMERVPRLRQRSLVDYVRRHYGHKISRRAAAAYLKDLGLSAPGLVKVEKPMRRFEAPTPLDLIQCSQDWGRLALQRQFP